MSIVMNFAPGVDTALLSGIFTVNRSAVGVPLSPGWLMRDTDPGSVWVLFFWADCANNPVPRDVFPSVRWHLVLVDKENGVSALNLPWYSLGQPSYFFSIRLAPYFFVLWSRDQVAVFQHLAGVPVEYCACQITQELHWVLT